ncbi:hypothetical protein MARGE09_P3692 [Marinagarivorans cellulosilyticus]|uniref:Probable membrane transporter protein n=1 Tax=Marinagarivorans cellulosilyticus TaxID=2721545 RepID=A0AAN1WKY6_9GAMM|nr:hypothetical protein MARGE09_P3692 [Marinagarivorans cellulosilyticus]
MFIDVLGVLLIPALLAGVVAGMFGLGGGVVMVPAIYFVLTHMGVGAELAMSMSVATSLLAIVVTGLSSALAHARLENIDFVLLKRWLLPLLCGAVVGSALVARYRTPALITFFGVFLWLVALMNVLVQRRAKPSGNVHSHNPFLNRLTLPLVFGIGCVAALAGVGGGTLSVPLLKSLGRDTHKAIGTSAAMGLALAFAASLNVLVFSAEDEGIPRGALGLFYLPALIVILPCTVLLAPVGAYLGKRMPAAVLDKLFVALLLLVGTRMVLSSFQVVG